MSRLQRIAARAEPVKVNDVIEEVSTLMLLAPGHPLRGQRCVLCAAAIGGQFCRLATLVDLRAGACTCGAISTITMLICDAHGDAAGVDWLTVLSERWQDHHGRVNV